MATEVSWNPGAVTAGSNINLPADAPKIARLVSAKLVRPSGGTVTPTTGDATHAACAATSAAYPSATSLGTFLTNVSIDAGQVVEPTPTKVDEDTITLNADTQARDLLVLRYERIGEQVKP